MLLLVLLASPVSVQAGKGFRIASSTLKNPVTVDGKWTTLDEWSDATGFDCGGYGWIALKDDANFLYVLVDYTRDLRAEAGDFAWVLWDQKNVGGTRPRTDDYDLSMTYETESTYDLQIAQGTGTTWGDSKSASSLGVVGASSTNATSDPHSKASHVTYEFRVPRLVLDNSTVITTVGFFAGAQNAAGGGIFLPLGVDSMVPNTWGQLTFSVPIPEFSQLFFTMALLIATLSIVLRRRGSPSA